MKKFALTAALLSSVVMFGAAAQAQVRALNVSTLYLIDDVIDLDEGPIFNFNVSAVVNPDGESVTLTYEPYFFLQSFVNPSVPTFVSLPDAGFIPADDICGITIAGVGEAFYGTELYNFIYSGLESPNYAVRTSVTEIRNGVTTQLQCPFG